MAILDLLSIGKTEPIETIDEEALKVEPHASLDKVLSELLDLYKKGLISIYQIPIVQLGQEFTERELSPETGDEIFGDLFEYAKKCGQERGFLDKIKRSNSSKIETHTPLGIYFKITERGESIIV